MGYRSKVVIGLHKRVLAISLISKQLPSLLANTVYTINGEAIYWGFEDIKWYPDYEEIREVEAFFNYLYDLQQKQKDSESLSLYGAMRMGENDNDYESWGDPYEFGIENIRDITYPR